VIKQRRSSITTRDLVTKGPLGNCKFKQNGTSHNDQQIEFKTAASIDLL